MSSLSSHRHLVDKASTGLVIPDINVWLALAAPEHPHNTVARRWWELHQGGIAFVRQSQTGLLRLTTTAVAMDGKPLSIDEAWRVYDRFYEDDRVTFRSEPADVERRFREIAIAQLHPPKYGPTPGCLPLQKPQAASWSLSTRRWAHAARGVCWPNVRDP